MSEKQFVVNVGVHTKSIKKDWKHFICLQMKDCENNGAIYVYTIDLNAKLYLI